jgi:hypothetical protein
MKRINKPDTAVASRTLITAGFSISNSHRQPTHIEIHCERSDLFGSTVPYLIAVCEGDEPPKSDLPNIVRQARSLNRTLVVVCNSGGAEWLSWKEFLDDLGGAVPSWRALGTDYKSVLLEAARNKKPKGLKGEAWQVFEDAVADGFEFILGNRVNRLGGSSRGKRVSDMITQTPDQRVLVIDAKASRKGFNATWPQLRPLVEYTRAQINRQRGHSDVHGAVVVSSEYKQDIPQLRHRADDFLAEVRVPLTFVKAEHFAGLVSTLGKSPKLRTSIDWARLFCRGSLLEPRELSAELKSAERQTYSRGSPIKA